MSGIRDILTLVYWFNDDKRSYLEESFRPSRPRSKERDAIKESLKKNEGPKDRMGNAPTNR